MMNAKDYGVKWECTDYISFSKGDSMRIVLEKEKMLNRWKKKENNLKILMYSLENVYQYFSENSEIASSMRHLGTLASEEIEKIRNIIEFLDHHVEIVKKNHENGFYDDNRYYEDWSEEEMIKIMNNEKI